MSEVITSIFLGHAFNAPDRELYWRLAERLNRFGQEPTDGTRNRILVEPYTMDNGNAGFPSVYLQQVSLEVPS